MMPLENILLKYIDKTATLEEIREVEQWISASPKNRRYLHELLTVHFESNHLKTYVDLDIDAEWNHFLLKKSEHLKPIEKSNPLRKIFYYIAAASIAFLLCFQVFYNADSHLEIIKSGNESLTVTLPDASQITIDPNSKIAHYDDFTDLSERRILLVGNATFDVVPNASKPFIVETKYFETKVLGTVFTVSAKGESNSIDVHEGSVSASSKDDATKKIVLKKGDTIYFDGDGFSDIFSEEISEVPVVKEEVEEGPEVTLSKFTLKDVFTFLDKTHVDKDKFSKSRKCKPKYEDIIALDLREDLESILKRIEAEYDVEYDDSPCDGCFKIKTIMKK